MASSSASIAVMVLLSFLVVSSQALKVNILDVLEPYPNFSLFREWLNTTNVFHDVNSRTTLTIMAPGNDAFANYVNATQDNKTISDTLRYHILLTYYAIFELDKIRENNYTQVTTLLQTTGRSYESQGFVTIFHTGKQFLVGHFPIDDDGNLTIVSQITSRPYDYSVLHLSAVLVPVPPNALPPALAPTPAPLPPAKTPKTTTETPSKKKNYASPLASVSNRLLLLSMLFTYCVGVMM